MPNPIVLDTANIPAGEVRDFFRDALADTLGRFEVEARGEGPMRHIFRLAGGSGAEIVSAQSTAVRMKASAKPDGDGMSFNLLRRGSPIRQTQGRRVLEAQVGEGFLDMLYEPYTFECCTAHTIEWIYLSRRRLATRMKDVEARTLDARTAQPEALALLSAYASVIQSLPSNPVLEAQVSEHLHDLAALILGPTRDGFEAARSGVRAARRAAIERFVDKHLSDPALDTAAVGRHFGLSPRYIRMIFADVGLPDLIASKRVALAARMLASPLLTDVKIIDIAFRCGFNSVSVFNRQFRGATGTTPSSYR